MKKAILIQFIPTALLICSCGGGLLTDMSRTLADPTIAVPTVTSFVSENRIDVSWSSDPGADRYMLERALDAVTPVFTIVYDMSWWMRGAFPFGKLPMPPRPLE